MHSNNINTIPEPILLALPEPILFEIYLKLSFKELIQLSRACIYLNATTKNYSFDLHLKIDRLLNFFNNDIFSELLKIDMDIDSKNKPIEEIIKASPLNVSNKRWLLKHISPYSHEHQKGKSITTCLEAELTKYSLVKASNKFYRKDLNQCMHRCVSFVYDILYDIGDSITFYNTKDPKFYFCNIDSHPDERINRYLVGLKQITLNNLKTGDYVVYKRGDKWEHIGLFLCEWNNKEYAISKFGEECVYIHPIHHTSYVKPFYYENKAALQPSVIVKLQAAKDELRFFYSNPNKANDSQLEEKSITLPSSGTFPINTLFNTTFSEIDSLVKKYSLPDHTQSSLEKGLRNAAANNKIDDLKLFIKYVNNLNAKDQTKGSEKTALHLAAIRGHHDCCRLLIDSGANKETEDGSGNKPEYYMKSKKLNIFS